MPGKVRNDRGGLLRQTASWPKHQAHEEMLALNWEELLIYPQCSVLCWFAAWVGALRPCHPFLQWELGFLGLLTPAAELSALGSLSQKAGMGEAVKGNTGSSATPGLRGVGVPFPWGLGKKRVYAMASIHSWKELLITAKLTVFNKYFAVCLQKGRGCPMAEVCCYNTIF